MARAKFVIRIITNKLMNFFLNDNTYTMNAKRKDQKENTKKKIPNKYLPKSFQKRMRQSRNK